MSFGQELCNLSYDTEIDTEILRISKEMWAEIKEALKKFAKETGEKGLTVFFSNIPNEAIIQLKFLAVKDDVAFMYWDSVNEIEFQNNFNEQIGVIAWDSSWFFKKYLFKVSDYFMIVANEEKIKVEIIATPQGTK